jgi:hypothetical protein
MKPSNATLDEIKDVVHSRHMAVTLNNIDPLTVDKEKYGPHVSYCRAGQRIWGFTFSEGRTRFLADFRATEVVK